jgi:hypothetical protein
MDPPPGTAGRGAKAIDACAGLRRATTVNACDIKATDVPLARRFGRPPR